MLQAARAVKDSARLLVRDLDPDAVPLCEALDLWKEFVEIGRLAASGATLMARRVEEADAWRKGGHRSAADHMAGESGTSVGETKRQLETSKRVRKSPNTAAAMRKGTLSPAKVEAIASAANVDRDAEEKLLEGAWNLHARGTIEDGARFRAKWQPLIDAQFKLARSEDRHEPHDAYAFDALVQLAEGFGAAEPEAEVPKTTDPNPTAKKPRVKRTPAKDLGLIRVDYETLVRGGVEGEGTCEVAGLGPIPVRIARALLGCTHSHRLENDHREDWAKTHHTRLDETDRLCKRDHHLKTHYG